MRDKILEIIKNENKNLNPIEIMDKIMPKSTAEDLRGLIHELDLMCRDGILRCASGNTYKLNDLIIGKVDMHEKGNAHVIVQGMDDVFINRGNMKGASDKDIVSIEITNPKENEGKIVKILKRSLGKSLAEVVNTDGVFNIVPLDKNLLYQIEIEENDLNLVDGLIVHLEYVKDLGKNHVLARIDHVIGHKNAAGHETQIAMIASEFNRSLFFPEDVLEEAKKFPSKLIEDEIEKEIQKGVVDLRGETTTTIDGKDTKDIDDAISQTMKLNGNIDEITDIADVSRYVKMNTSIWKYAEMKGNSDYLANKVGPMLPIELSNGICSLNPNENRFAMSVRYELDQKGNIINPDMFLSVIKSKKKMNYDAVQDIIDGKETEDTKDYTTIKYTVKDKETIDDIAFKYCITKEDLLEYNDINDFKKDNEVNIPVKAVIKLMYRASKIMEGSLQRRGKIDFESSKEVKYEFDEDDNLIDIIPRVQRDSERIIENHMIYANEAVAMYMTDALSKILSNMVPFVFRIHGDPNPEKIEDFMNMIQMFGIEYPHKINADAVTSRDIQQLVEFLKEKENYKIFNTRLLRCMQKAIYSPDNSGHFGIASNLYCHFTSPIRRMADLLIHTIFRVFIVEKDTSSENIKFWASYLSEVCEHISECERDAEKCEYAVDDYFGALYMQNRIGQGFEAIIDGLSTNCLFVQTDKNIEGRVDFVLDEESSKELLLLEDPEEIENFILEHRKPFEYEYIYDEKKYGYTRKGRVVYRYGDKVFVHCIGSDPESRHVDFALVRKL